MKILIVSSRPKALGKATYAARVLGYSRRVEKNLKSALPIDFSDCGLAVIDMQTRLFCAENRNLLASISEEMPVVVFVDRFVVRDEIMALRAGADAVLKTSCRRRLLVARIYALRRRQLSKEKKRILQAGPFMLDLDQHVLLGPKGRQTVSVGVLRALKLLMKQPGHTVAKELFNCYATRASGGEWSAHTVILRVRRALVSVGGERKTLATTYGIGWQLQV